MYVEKQCRRLYREAFNDPDTDFENKLFKHCFKYCRVVKVGDEVASMLFALPCILEMDCKSLKAYYIYSLSTFEKYRGQGFASRLVNSLKLESDRVLFLKPTTDSLIGFYKKLGFDCFKASLHETCGAVAVPDSDFLSVALGETDENDGIIYTAMYYYKEKLNLDNLYFAHTMN